LTKHWDVLEEGNLQNINDQGLEPSYASFLSYLHASFTCNVLAR